MYLYTNMQPIYICVRKVLSSKIQGDSKVTLQNQMSKLIHLRYTVYEMCIEISFMAKLIMSFSN